MIGWEDYIYTLVISFVSMGNPYKGQIEELFIVMVNFMDLQHNIVNFLINLTVLFATYLSKHDIAYLC